MKRNTVFLLFSVVLAALAAWVAVAQVQSFNETKRVLVAVKDIEPYAPVKAEEIKLADVPAASVPADAVVDPKAVIGKYLRYPVFAGEVVRKARIADASPDKGLMAARLTALQDSKGLRAFALPYDVVSGVGGEVKEGDLVDLVASVKIETGSGTMGVGKIIAAGVKVLKTTKPEGTDKGTVVVALTPEQIEDLAFALTSGQVRLALNPYEPDLSAASTKGVTGAAWLEKYGFRIVPKEQPKEATRP